ncbi:MAG: hypothetical protein K0Q49_28 [Haloplasmataceae bacterium]|nr:hypothetical protein [Haloplasmataceae bacterium]
MKTQYKSHLSIIIKEISITKQRLTRKERQDDALFNLYINYLFLRSQNLISSNDVHHIITDHHFMIFITFFKFFQILIL